MPTLPLSQDRETGPGVRADSRRGNTPIREQRRQHDDDDSQPEMLQMDTTDVDRWIGVPLGGQQLKEPFATNDIRRFVQGDALPQPAATTTRSCAAREPLRPHRRAAVVHLGGGTRHGATPSIQGTIPGSHLLFGGDEWWFFGPRIFPGDQLRMERMLYDYRVTNTSFAGPTMFSARRHDLHQPARRAHRPAALDRRSATWSRTPAGSASSTTCARSRSGRTRSSSGSSSRRCASSSVPGPRPREAAVGDGAGGREAAAPRARAAQPRRASRPSRAPT